MRYAGAAFYIAILTVCAARVFIGGPLNWRDLLAVGGLTVFSVSWMVAL